ncbi:MAG: undecaprenyl/decaprenyl-phosphate alpha-N-acetylglucosaminyl 1-phosphate transferase [Candidatus Acetothermia bacterium]|nr:undecaprenyl/decaprenyl-phosphate alpha-N-acetylglucosaminyl 1-phosphate transferase [Candidatus Acetothermia bacterium]MDH7505115.1 MraY family glycosyltransferase [Candidatus Acetothermia bacterium]
MPYFRAFLMAALSSLILAKLSELVAPRLGLVDRSNERKIHQGARPIGGLALLGGLLIGAGPLLPWSREVSSVLLGVIVIAGLGLLDDLRGLGAKSKLLVQALASLIPVLWGGLWVRSLGLGGAGLELGPWGIPLTIIWVVGITNALNFIDGLDGLAAGSSLIAVGFIALFAWKSGGSIALALAVGLAGAVAGFLRYNFYPARLFLGNEGAYILGFLLAVLALEPFGHRFGPIERLPVLPPLILLGLPIADTLWAILRRLRARRSVFAPDRGHIHHRLLARWGYGKALLILYLVSLALGVLAVAGWWR